jgi:hypothetical protein
MCKKQIFTISVKTFICTCRSIVLLYIIRKYQLIVSCITKKYLSISMSLTKFYGDIKRTGILKWPITDWMTCVQFPARAGCFLLLITEHSEVSRLNRKSKFLAWVRQPLQKTGTLPPSGTQNWNVHWPTFKSWHTATVWQRGDFTLASYCIYSSAQELIFITHFNTKLIFCRNWCN